MVAEEMLHKAPRVRRMELAADAVEADIGRAEVEDIDLAVEEGIGPAAEERHRAAAVVVGDRDCEKEHRKVAVAGDMDYVLGERVGVESYAVVTAGRTGLEVGRPEVGRSLGVALVVEERRSPVVAGILLVGDTGLAEAADIQVAESGPHSRDSHLGVEGMTCFQKFVH